MVAKEVILFCLSAGILIGLFIVTILIIEGWFKKPLLEDTTMENINQHSKLISLAGSLLSYMDISYKKILLDGKNLTVEGVDELNNSLANIILARGLGNYCYSNNLPSLSILVKP